VSRAGGTAVDPFGSVLARYRKVEPEPVRRKSGRPTKRTPEYFAALLAKHEELEARYVAEHGATPESVKFLYTAYFAELFTARGERASRASSADFQGALKTLRNELAVARRLSVAVPRTDVFSGRGPTLNECVQRRVSTDSDAQQPTRKDSDG
jgi:hypothetical protein